MANIVLNISYREIATCDLHLYLLPSSDLVESELGTMSTEVQEAAVTTTYSPTTSILLLQESFNGQSALRRLFPFWTECPTEYYIGLHGQVQCLLSPDLN